MEIPGCSNPKERSNSLTPSGEATNGRPTCRWFDAHMHVFDPAFPMAPNAGFLPPPFTVEDYLTRVSSLPAPPIGGAIVSASTQGFDQSYLLAALKRLGPGWVGVTQLPPTVTDTQLLDLHAAGVRALRFNLYRGGRQTLDNLTAIARRVYAVAGWHAEVYLDARDLPDVAPLLMSLPRVCIDHLGLSHDGLPELLRLAGAGAYVKASGFGRLDYPAVEALGRVNAANERALVFGTDLPNPRAPRPFMDEDLYLVTDHFDSHAVRRLLCDNALELYRPPAGVVQGGSVRSR